jgi:hypothetical protein
VKEAKRNVETRRTLSPPAWALVGTLAASGLLAYTGVQTGEWRGVVVTEVQILVVGLVTWFVLRAGDEPS